VEGGFAQGDRGGLKDLNQTRMSRVRQSSRKAKISKGKENSQDDTDQGLLCQITRRGAGTRIRESHKGQGERREGFGGFSFEDSELSAKVEREKTSRLWSVLGRAGAGQVAGRAGVEAASWHSCGSKVGSGAVSEPGWGGKKMRELKF